MSLDGFIAGPNQSVENPLGEGGEKLHEWAIELAAWRASHGMAGGIRPSSWPHGGFISAWQPGNGRNRRSITRMKAHEATSMVGTFSDVSALPVWRGPRAVRFRTQLVSVFCGRGRRCAVHARGHRRQGERQRRDRRRAGRTALLQPESAPGPRALRVSCLGAGSRARHAHPGGRQGGGGQDPRA